MKLLHLAEEQLTLVITGECHGDVFRGACREEGVTLCL